MSGIKALLGKFSKVSRSNKKTEQKATTVNTSTEGYANFRQTHLHKCHTRHATTTEISTTNSTNELSLLFIIIDSLPHEEIWKKWLASSGNGSGTCTGAHIATATNDDVVPIIHILIHAKYPHKVTSPWVRERLVTSFQYEPAWGSVDIAKVMIGLLKEVSTKAAHSCIRWLLCVFPNIPATLHGLFLYLVYLVCFAVYLFKVCNHLFILVYLCIPKFCLIRVYGCPGTVFAWCVSPHFVYFFLSLPLPSYHHHNYCY